MKSMILGALSILVFQAGHAMAAEFDPSQYLSESSPHSYHYKNRVPVEYDLSRVAVEVDIVRDFDWSIHGFSPAQVEPMAIPGWAYVSLDPMDQSIEGMMKTLDHLESRRGVYSVSPVLVDDRGYPLVPTPVILVQFRDGKGLQPANTILQALDIQPAREVAWPMMPGSYKVNSNRRNGWDVMAQANALSERDDVIFAEPDMIFVGVTHELIPDDPLFPDCWGLKNTGQQGGQPGADLRATFAWDTTTGDAAVRVLIMDTGVQQDHPDLNQDPGQDFTNDPHPGGGPGNECDKHGTTVAGCVSAVINNNLGVVGVAPGVKSVSARIGIATTGPFPGFCSNSFGAQSSWLVDALQWSLVNHCLVTNASIGLGGNPASIQNAYEATRAGGMIHFASAGNSNIPSLGRPAAWPPVNGVGAINRFGDRAGFSSWGFDVDEQAGLGMTAPGQEIWTTDRTGGEGYSGTDYAQVQGTSFSSPYAAGVAALLISAYLDENPDGPALAPEVLETIINDTCMDLGDPGYDFIFGNGLPDLSAAMDEIQQGGCCIDSNCELVANASSCEALGGIYLGPGSECPEDCTAIGACCQDIGCVDVSIVDCVGLDGSFTEGAVCQDVDCNLTGACCDRGDCTVRTIASCDLIGGTFLGGNSNCSDPDACLPSCLKELDLSVLQDSEDYLGNAVSTSEGYILVGSMGRDRTLAEPNTGIAYLYNANATRELQPPTTGGVHVGAGGPNDFFGCSVSLSDEGGDGIAAVGAYKFDYGDFSDLDAGIAYAFSSPDWNSVDPPYVLFNPSEYRNDFDYFGYAVAAAGPNHTSRVIVGAPRSDVFGLDSGSAYWFETSGGSSANSNASWGTLIKFSDLEISDQPQPFDYVGHAVGMCYSAPLFYGGIGAPGADEQGYLNAGRVYVATQSPLGPGSSDPSLVISVVPNHAPHLFKQFGRSIDLYDENGTPYMIVGALVRESSSDSGPDGTGIAFVYKGSGAGGFGGGSIIWTRQGPLYPNPNPNPDPVNDDCARSVSLTSQDGTLYAILGCPGAHANGLSQPGIAVLYKEEAGNWSELSRLVACDQTPYDAFGHSVSIDQSVLVGAPHAFVDSQGAVFQKLLSNVLQGASSGNGIRSAGPNWSPADLASPVSGMGQPDGIVDVSDLMAIIELWGGCDHDCAYLTCLGDLDGDCRIDSRDLLIVIQSWGS